MAVSQQELVEAWRHVLTLCKLGATETVCLLTRPDIHQQNVNAAEHVARQIGAYVLRLEPAIDTRSLHENKVAMQALKSSGLVIDFLGLHLLRRGEQEEVIRSGARILYVVEPPEALVRLLPTEEDKRRVRAAEACIRKSKSMQVTSAAGTELHVQLGEYPILSEWGYSDEPGHWDHWPSAFVATWPNERSAQGTVVLRPGDIIFPFKSYVRDEIRLQVSDGYITQIDGGFDAEVLREYMSEFEDLEAYAVSHLGWGLNPRARWSRLALLDKHQTNGNDGRAFAGNFMFSTGPNTDAGGSRNTLCHLDIPMRKCSVSLDGVPMTIDGKVVAKGQT
ncbi:MAG: 2,5-dihydroxypyridine 5,6-dioxygenase [Anaerolineales bacterium]|nr:2,5-dihydroxypyridine 5,6-dioxygenase [Alphaproteobacteria bacterium]MCW5886791.1 2,5-dihydroxypyridine 5,6-dioxygenase [Anaerolineales bacterium]